MIPSAPSNTRSLTLPLIVFLLAMLMLGWGLSFNTGSPDAERIRRAEISGAALIGAPFPEFRLERVTEDAAEPSFLTKADLLANNQPVIVNIFASWCPDCQREHPLLMQLAKEKQWPIYGVAWKNKAEDLKLYLQREGSPYQAIGLDPNGELMLMLGSTGVPESMVVGPDGTIRAVVRGGMTDAIIASQITAAMETR